MNDENKHIDPVDPQDIDPVLFCLCYILSVVITLVGACAVILIVSLLTSCKSHIELAGSTQKDSVRIEYREILKIEKDTQYVEIPAAISERITRDSVSILHNSFAISTAKLQDGLLYHSLEQIKQDLPVSVDKQILYRDSIVYRDRDVEVVKTKEVEKKLSAYQRISIYGFNALLLVLLLLVIVQHRKQIWNFVRRFI